MLEKILKEKEKIKIWMIYKMNEIILDIGAKTIKKIVEKRLINLIQFYGMDQLDILKMKTFLKVLYLLQKISQKILLKNL